MSSISASRLLPQVTSPQGETAAPSGAGADASSVSVSASAAMSLSMTAWGGVNAFQGQNSIVEGGCYPQPPSCPRQQSVVQQLLALVMSVLQLVTQLLGRQQQGNCPGSPTPSPGSPDCQSPGSPTPSPTPSPSSPDCQSPSPSPCPPSPCPPPPSCGTTGKTWDVFFDAKQGTKTQQRSPIILDLNGNGRPDITGSNIKGNGKLEGKAVNFDLDPTQRQWAYKSEQRRPGAGAPALPKGTQLRVFDAQGRLVSEKLVAEVAGKGKKGNYGLQAGQRAEFRDESGRLVGELKPDGKKGKMMYFWESKNQNEWTKPWDANGGDGILVWDHDSDGKITSGKELFGEFDVDGQKKFSNGYEKLAKHFDKNGDGQVAGDELNGLKIWEDRNGDGLTQKGELVELRDRGVTSLNVNFNSNDMSSSFRKA